MPNAQIDNIDSLIEWNHGNYEGRATADIERERPGWCLFRDGCPGGETPEAVCERADRLIDQLRSMGGNTLLFGHREIFRVLAARWIGLEPAAGRYFLLATASLSSLGYDHNLTDPTLHSWNSVASEGQRGLH
jgi:broad specificity phosphatase PhoE